VALEAIRERESLSALGSRYELTQEQISKWKHGIQEYMSENGRIYYDREVGESFIRDRVSPCVSPGERDLMRSVRVLSEYLETGSVSKKSVHRRTVSLPGEAGVCALSFIDGLKRERRSKTTLYGHRLYLHYFIAHLNRLGIESVTDIRDAHILQFVSSLTNNSVCIVSSLRLFLRYLYSEKKTPTDLSYVLSGYKFEKREKLPSVYRKEEVVQIEASVERVEKTYKYYWHLPD